MYVFTYTDYLGKRHYKYSKDLVSLRKKEEQIKKDQLDGIDSYLAGNVDLNYLFDRYMAVREDLRVTTKANYEAAYDRYVRNALGKVKLSEINQTLTSIQSDINSGKSEADVQKKLNQTKKIDLYQQI